MSTINSNRDQNPRRVLYGVTLGISARKFLAGQLDFLNKRGWDVHLVCSPDRDVQHFARMEGSAYHAIPVKRNPSPIADVASLVRLFQLISQLQPATIVMGTPKMGLLGLTAGLLARTPRRIYVMHGLKLDGSNGPTWRMLRAFERLSCAAATDIIAVSPSLRARALELGLAAPTKIHVLRNGSANGFLEDDFPVVTWRERLRARAELEIPEDAQIVLYIGRVTRDKGLHDLFDVWPKVLDRLSNAHLILAGTLEVDSESDKRIASSLFALDHVTYVPFTDDVHSLYAATDVMLMPTIREGLGNVAIEAALSGIPTIAYATTGTVDAVVPGVTGELIKLGDRLALVESLLNLLTTDTPPYDARAMHEVMKERFDRGLLWNEWSAFLEGRNLGTDQRP